MKFVAFRIEYSIFTKGVFNYIIKFSFLLRSSFDIQMTFLIELLINNNKHYQNKEASNSDIVIDTYHFRNIDTELFPLGYVEKAMSLPLH